MHLSGVTIENYIRYLYRYIWRKLEAEKGWATFALQNESTPWCASSHFQEIQL